MRIDRRGWLLALYAGLCGCSALIDPDEGRLGGDFDASVTTDAGRADGGARDASTDGAVNDGGPRDAGPGDDGGPVCPPSCDDSIACTSDSCVAGRCAHEANDAACGDGERCNPVMGCVPIRCTTDPECADGLFCNGVERCDASAPGTGCVPGAAVVCDDRASCTADRCDEDADACAFAPSDAACADTVDCTTDRCAPSDSSDATGCVHAPVDSACAGDFCTVGRTCDPSVGCVGGAPRDCRDGNPCTADRCDGSASMCVSALRDEDMDGYGPISVPGAGGTTVMCGGTDCNDGNRDVNPAATELCNGVDDNCDGTVDEGCSTIPDTCASAGAIVLNSSGNGAARGTFSDFADDYQTNPICRASSGGRDAVYYVDLPPGTWDLTIDTIGSAADTILGVGLDCSAAGLQAVCNDDYTRSSITRQSRVWVHRIQSTTLSPRRVYILVDAYDATVGGDYVVNVRRRSVGSDSCPSGTGGTLPLEITGGGTVLGFQTGFVGSQRGSCQASFDTAGEAIFRFDGDPSGNADFEVYSTDFTPDIYVRSAPCGSGTELDCDLGSGIGGGVSGASLRLGVTSGALHYLFVDGGRTAYAVYYQPY